MNETKLSICIPTFNREAFLRKLLAHCRDHLKFEFPYEIIVVDNGSTDDTPAVAEEFANSGMPVIFMKRTVNAGWSAMAGAYLRAKGEYALYLADDDLLIGDGAAAAVQYLDRNPDVVACYAPWFLHDEVADRDTMKFYQVDADTKYARQSFNELFDFLYQRHVFPEIGIYRTATLRSAYAPREFCFWAFSYLANFLDMGAVAFLERPFYRSVTRSTVAHNREQAGYSEVMTAWDRYRGGLEYFLYVGAKRGKIDFSTPAHRQKYEEKCRIFTLNRMAVALRFWMARKDYIKAYELYVRLVYGGMSHHDEVKQVRGSLQLMASVQTFARQVNAVLGIRRVVLSNVTDLKSLAGLLYEVGMDPGIEITGEPDTHAPEKMQETVVFTAQAADRKKFIALGYAPNLVFSETDLTGGVIV